MAQTGAAPRRGAVVRDDSRIAEGSAEAISRAPESRGRCCVIMGRRLGLSVEHRRRDRGRRCQEEIGRRGARCDRTRATAASWLARSSTSLMHDGKSSTAERVFYDALDVAEERSKKPGYRGLRAGGAQRDAHGRGEAAARGWLHLPGAHGDPPRAPRRRWPFVGSSPSARGRSGSAHGRAAGGRAHGRRQQHGAHGPEARKRPIAWPRPTRPSPTTAGSRAHPLRRAAEPLSVMRR